MFFSQSQKPPYAIILAYILHTVHSVLPQVTGKSLMTTIVMRLQQLEWNCNGCIDYNCNYLYCTTNSSSDIEKYCIITLIPCAYL